MSDPPHTDTSEVGLRIGELSRRVGISTDVLRAWERRYGVLQPRRSPAGQRLYSRADERRLRRMQRLIGQGYAPQVAARLALSDTAPAGTAAVEPSPANGAAAPARGEPGAGELAALEPLGADLRRALDAYDDAAANTILDQLLSGYGIETVLRAVILPLLQEIGHRWARNELSVAQEHFASALLVGRLRALARGWDQGVGPRALVACPAGEAHDLGLLCFSLLLRQRGYRISYLGASVPGDSLAGAAASLEPEVIVVAAVRPEPFWDSLEALRELSAAYPLAIGGAGASRALADQLSADLLSEDIVAAADAVASAARPA